MSKLNELFETSLHVVNFGIESFYDDLVGQKVDAVQVDWKPVAGGDKGKRGRANCAATRWFFDHIGDEAIKTLRIGRGFV